MMRVVPDPEPWRFRDFAAGFAVVWTAIALTRAVVLAVGRVAGLLPKTGTR